MSSLGTRYHCRSADGNVVDMVCAIQPCSRPPFTRCAKCRGNICSNHAEDCDGCGQTFCPACYQQHVREEREAC